jgi:glycosyltransferase involved in cell wall biosynthesis
MDEKGGVIMFLNVTCPINNLSYGLVSKNILDNLKEYTLLPLGPINKEDAMKYSKHIAAYYEVLNLNDPSLRIFHENMLMEHIGKGLRVGFPIFEKNRFDYLTRFNLKHQDLIVVASKWAKSVIETELYHPNVIVANLGVDNDFRPVKQTMRDKIVFLNIGKREVRKGHDLLHKLFYKAFQNITDVELWMMSGNAFDSQEEQYTFQKEYKNLLGDKVFFIPRISKEMLISTINKADVGIFPSRAEGWNLPLHECMACGLDIIATNYSAHTEFLPDLPGVYKINGNNTLKTAYDGKWFHGDFEWFNLEACEEEIIEAMLSAYKNKKENRDKNLAISNHAREFTWEKTTRSILDGIQKT